MTRTTISIANVTRLLQLYDPTTNMNVIDEQQRPILSFILTKIGFYGQRNNVNAVKQAINAVVTHFERKIPLEIRSEQSISLYKQYLRTVEGTMQERINTDTHEKILAIFSVMFFIFQYSLAGDAIPSLMELIKRKEIYYEDDKVNPYFWTTYLFITMPNTKDKRRNDSSRITEAKRIFSKVNGVEFRDNYQGFDFVNGIDNFINKQQINVHMYTYSDSPPRYELTQNYLVNDSDNTKGAGKNAKQFSILFINDGNNAHIMYVSDVEALTEFRYCNIFHKQTFGIGDPNLQT
ncbi:MAG: hypothetical protein EZS28_015348 [Streblomastix strix]|uniref:Uncharacterized protein n=1 Tax=Streblomastix strix TaxID=222440 RepID=A0A5J4W2B5_9EUKA|nr:MAG: hypothetical protein EZS28_015348 [Streblomastix strix]